MHRLQSVRVRATIGAAAVVAVALVVAGLGLVASLHASQLAVVDSNLELRATDIKALIRGGAHLDTVAVERDEDGFVQLLDEDGEVVASSRNIEGAPAVIKEDDGRFVTQKVPAVDEDDFRIHFERVRPGDGGDQEVRTVVVGRNLETVSRAVVVVSKGLVLAIPMLVVLMALMVWVIVGRALRPVEEIRAEVADIGAGDLDRRVPEPATHDEIGRLAHTMNKMLDRLEAADVAQARFVSDASHELRTPIAVIRHQLEVALRSDDETQLRAAAGEVLDEGVRMQRLVDDLLFLVRHDASTDREVDLRLVDLDDLVLGEAGRVQTDVEVDTSRVSAGQVRGDADRLARVVRNLVDNALRHAERRVAIGVTSVDGKVVLDVDDDGEGVAEADRTRIFERFGRADESRARDDGGSGLGLAIAWELVAEHGGELTVGTSPTLGGARFTVTLDDARS